MRIIVLVKQVPDTKNIGPDAMTEEGIVNRGALPAIFNPDDLAALELALRIKDNYPDTKITAMTMGLPKAQEVLRESVMRGADDAILLTDKTLGGADTLATSYALSQAIRRIGEFDMIICGRQAIDGDTAQVGPQVAEKLGIPQITYVTELEWKSEEKDYVTTWRRIDGGKEKVQTSFLCVLTIDGSNITCRPRNIKRMMRYKNIEIERWGAKDIDADESQIGRQGSPTKVKNVKNIVFKAKETKTFTENEVAKLADILKEII